jgi:glycoprotein endo-alpha-1,2-mannosidase
MHRDKRIHILLFVLIALVMVLQDSTALNAESLRESMVSRKVLAFYYPWYGTADGPGGEGRTVHWGRIDAVNKDIQASTHYPIIGAYDSHDPKLIDQHCQWAKLAGIDTLIVSWWGHNSYTDRVMNRILDGCRQHGLTACIYYETVPRPQTAESAANDIVKVLEKYGEHPAHLKVNGRPVVFIYGRTLQELGLTDWLKAIRLINEKYKGGITTIGDQFSYGSARIFDGVHTYNPAGSLQGQKPDAARKWASETYKSWVRIADQAGKISTITVIPGYDDTKIRKPGLAVERYKTRLYRAQWEEAIKADPHWILITSFNEWHEGSEIEPSAEYKDEYLELTGKYAKRFKAKKRSVHQQAARKGLSSEEQSKLLKKLGKLRIGVLPAADSMAFWWLMDLGVSMEVLTWDEVVGGDLTTQKYPILLYCSGEHYRRTVNKSGDVDDALAGYLKAGGFLAVLPGLPWPFYYDEDNNVVNGGGRFGLNIQGGWERPPQDLKLNFLQPQRHLSHVPEQFPFPASGDLRWRAFFAGKDTKHTSLLQLHNGEGKYLGDAVAYAELKNGGRIVYAWFSLLNGPHAEGLLYDIFDLVAIKLRK